MSSIAIKEKVGEGRRSVEVAGSIEGRQEVVVDVVIAPKRQNCYGLCQVLCQVGSTHHRSELIQGALKVQYLLTQAIPFSLCHNFHFHEDNAFNKLLNINM